MADETAKPDDIEADRVAEADRGSDPRPDRLRPELRKIFDERWARNEAGYRFLAGR